MDYLIFCFEINVFIFNLKIFYYLATCFKENSCPILSLWKQLSDDEQSNFLL